jgi:hypothetical protein
VEVGAGNGPVSVGVPLTGLSPGTTYHAQFVATNADGPASSGDVAFTIPTPGAGRPMPPVAPTLTHVRQSARRWLEGNQLATISAFSRLPVGTNFTFAANEPALVTFTFTQAVAGRKGTGGCVPLTRHRARGRPCRATVVRGRLSLAAHQGMNRVRFQGLLSRGRRLKPGTYTVLITASLPGAPASAPAKLIFTIDARVR